MSKEKDLVKIFYDYLLESNSYLPIKKLNIELLNHLTPSEKKSIQKRLVRLKRRIEKNHLGGEYFFDDLDPLVNLRINQIYKDFNLDSNNTSLEKEEKNKTEDEEGIVSSRASSVDECKDRSDFNEFIESHEIDLDSVSQVYIKEKADGSVRFTVRYKPNVESERSIIDSIEEHLGTYNFNDYISKQSLINEKYNNLDRRVSIINIFDAHVDKLGYGGYDNLEKNIKTFLKYLKCLLSDVHKKRPEKIIFVVGSDIFHTNDQNLTTINNTDLKNSVGNTRVSFSKVLDMYITSINLICKYTNEVEVIVLGGNHDYERVTYMGVTLRYLYDHVEKVTIKNRSNTSLHPADRSENDTPDQRIYSRYGNYLFGFAHGNLEKNKVAELPSLMSVERRKDWAEIQQGIFFLGDIHHERIYNYLRTQDFRGVNVKFLRAFAEDDQYLVNNGWIGVKRTVYAYTYSFDGSEETVDIKHIK